MDGGLIHRVNSVKAPRMPLRSQVKPIVFSMNDYRQEEWLTNIPLYAVEHLILKINCTDHYRALLISSMTRDNSSFVSEA